MYFTGFADEAGKDFDLQLKATKELGWENIETRALLSGNLASISDEEFEQVCEKLDANGIKFNCFGSGIANWSQNITDSPEPSYEELRKAIPRMEKLGIKMVRMMSFAVPEELRPQSMDYFDEVVKRVQVLTKMAEHAGILLVHENCTNWGGLSYEHTLKLLDKVNSPNFKLVFDTGNPVLHKDYRGDAPYSYQNAWEFYSNVKEHIVYIHIKDGIIDADDKMVYSFPGEGAGYVRKILTDAFKNGYDGGISIEPHMAFVFHDSSQNKDQADELAYQNYVEYGHKMMILVDSIKAE
ncbi:MAG: sugar phosphate isomerase/epimerase [Victivallaceae bacterium]|nr:sugar phosphate isomerase/epimerase [Victivallaceae bacterium]